MRRKIGYSIAAAAMIGGISLGTAGTALADHCLDSGGPGNSDFAAHVKASKGPWRLQRGGPPGVEPVPGDLQQLHRDPVGSTDLTKFDIERPVLIARAGRSVTVAPVRRHQPRSGSRALHVLQLDEHHLARPPDRPAVDLLGAASGCRP